MKKFINTLFVNHSVIYKLVLYVITIFLVVYLLPKSGHFKYEFQKGKVWEYDNLYAPFDFSIQKSLEEIEKEKQAIKELSPNYFVYNTEIANATKKLISLKVKEELENWNSSTAEKQRLIAVTNEITQAVYEYGFIDDALLKKSKKTIFIKNGPNLSEVPNYKLFSSKEVLKFIASKVGKLDSSLSSLENAIIGVVFEHLKQNVFFDDEFTNRVLKENLNSISYTTGLITQNERIIFKGDIVEGEKFAILNSLKSEFESQIWSEANYKFIVLGYTILVALAFLMLLLFLRKYRYDIFENNNKVTFIFLNVFLVVLLLTVIMRYNPKYIYVAPIVILPLILKAFFDSRLGLFTHTLSVLLLGFLVPNPFEFIFLQIIAGIVTILTIAELHKRSNLFLSVLQITGVYCISYFAFSLIQEGNAHNLDYSNFLYFALNGAATLFVLPLIYIFERTFGLVSDESLKELSNTNSKLLRELAEKAPGTFQHSLQVANLAEACAIEINANAMLVRTGALYHDIGKMDNPMFFTENQTTGVNPHNELNPRDSAHIIINHIIKGVELAKKHYLPDRIIDFIRTHHGTSLVYYFYKKEEELNNGIANLEYFRYPGPIPFSKETAILMMCDGVEATSKSIKEPTAQAFDELVERIINKQMDEGQFMNADITFKEMQVIKKVLKKKLKGIYHLRIEYPK